MPTSCLPPVFALSQATPFLPPCNLRGHDVASPIWNLHHPPSLCVFISAFIFKASPVVTLLKVFLKNSPTVGLGDVMLLADFPGHTCILSVALCHKSFWLSVSYWEVLGMKGQILLTQCLVKTCPNKEMVLLFCFKKKIIITLSFLTEPGCIPLEAWSKIKTKTGQLDRTIAQW